MLLAPLRYSAAHAAVQADLSRLVTRGQWDQLLGTETLEDALSVLATTDYGDDLAGLPPEPAPIERWLRHALAARLRLPLPYLRGAARVLIDWLSRRFEVENLTILLRGIHEGIAPSRLSEYVVPLADGSDLDWRALASSRSIPELSSKLERVPRGLPYARALRHALHEYQRRGSTFTLEVALQLAYYRKLRRLMDRATGADARWIARLVGAELDRENVIRAYRARIFFKLEPEAILAYMLPRGERVDTRVIRRIATGEAPQETADAVWDRELLELDLEGEPRAAVVSLEHGLRRYRHRLARAALTGNTIHLGAILAHAVLVEDEVHDLIALLEGKESGWSASRIRSELITPESER